MKDSLKQKRAIEHFKAYGVATFRQIQQVAGVNNAAETVSQLRKKGHEIITERITIIDRDGSPCRIGLYRYLGEVSSHE